MLYNIRRKSNYYIFKLLTNLIYKTKPLPLSDDPVFSIHSLVREQDLNLYLLAIKSFISKISNAEVFVHSDGTLSNRSASILQYHLPGIKIIHKAESDSYAKSVLTKEAFAIRNYYTSYKRLIDSVLYSTQDYHMQMDSDFLTLKHPTYIEEILLDKKYDSPFIICDFYKDDLTKKPQSPNEHIQTKLERAKKDIENELGYSIGNTNGLCAGLYGWSNQLSIKKIVNFVTACEKIGFKMNQWGTEQVTTTWLLRSSNAKILPTNLYINLNKYTFDFTNDAHMIHFIGRHRFKRGLYIAKARKVIKTLL